MARLSPRITSDLNNAFQKFLRAVGSLGIPPGDWQSTETVTDHVDLFARLGKISVALHEHWDSIPQVESRLEDPPIKSLEQAMAQIHSAG